MSDFAPPPSHDGLAFTMKEIADGLNAKPYTGVCGGRVAGKSGTVTEVDKPILDSGERRQFETGAQRDRAKGKGLPTLIPFSFVSEVVWCVNDGPRGHSCAANALLDMYSALDDLLLEPRSPARQCDIIRKLGEAVIPFFMTWYNPDHWSDEKSLANMLRDQSKHLEKGAEKYSARNWEKGMPLEEYFNSMIRHLLSVMEGNEDENHKAACVFNYMALLHTATKIVVGALPESLAFPTPPRLEQLPVLGPMGAGQFSMDVRPKLGN